MANLSSVELSNARPLETERLSRRAYGTAPVIGRRSVLVALGGVAEDRVLAGYEYYDLWCRIAHRGWESAFVQQILARGRRLPSVGGDVAAIASEVTCAGLRRSVPSILSDRRMGDSGRPS